MNMTAGELNAKNLILDNFTGKSVRTGHTHNIILQQSQFI